MGLLLSYGIFFGSNVLRLRFYHNSHNCKKYSGIHTISNSQIAKDGDGHSQSEINVLIKSIQKVRDSTEFYHKIWYDHVCSIAKTVDATVKKPRTASRQQHRSNLPATDVSSYYRVNVVVPFLDHLLNEMNTRFSSASCSAVKKFSIIASNLKASVESHPKVDK